MEAHQPNHLRNTDNQIAPLINNEPTPAASTRLSSLTDSNDFNIPAQRETIPSQSHPSEYHLTLQPLPSSPQSESLEELLLPELEPVIFSDDEEHSPQNCDEDGFFTSLMEQNSHPCLHNGTVQEQSCDFYEHGRAPRTPSAADHGAMQQSYRSQSAPQPLSPNVTNPVTSMVSPSEKNAERLVDAWFIEMQQQLSRYPVLRIDTMAQRGHTEFIPHYLNETLQQDSSRIPVLHTESIPQSNNPPTPNHLNDGNEGADVPPNHLAEDDAHSAEPSNVANIVNQLYGRHVEQGQTFAVSENNNAFITDSSMTGPHQELQKAPSQSDFPHHQHDKCGRELVSLSAKPNPTVHTENPTLRPHSMQGAITKLPHHRGSRSPVGKIQCEECPELFESKVNASRHLESCHPKKKKKFACMHCSASYGGPGPRKIHMRKGHPKFMPPLPPSKPIAKQVNGTIRYFCSVPSCTNSYTVQNNVKRHFEMDHLKIRYPCTCGHKATTKHNLQTHQTSCRIFRELQRDSEEP